MFAPAAASISVLGACGRRVEEGAHLSVAENMELAAYTLDRNDAAPAIDRQVRKFPVLREKWNLMAGNLSGGEQQMLEMAMVLVARPALLLIDEPSLGRSPKMRFEVLETIRGLSDTGIAVLMVEQNVRGGLAVADRAVVMDLALKVMEGTPERHPRRQAHPLRVPGRSAAGAIACTKWTPSASTLADEFFDRPLGTHSFELHALMILMRGPPGAPSLR